MCVWRSAATAHPRTPASINTNARIFKATQLPARHFYSQRAETTNTYSRYNLQRNLFVSFTLCLPFLHKDTMKTFFIAPSTFYCVTAESGQPKPDSSTVARSPVKRHCCTYQNRCVHISGWSSGQTDSASASIRALPPPSPRGTLGFSTARLRGGGRVVVHLPIPEDESQIFSPQGSIFTFLFVLRQVK